MAIGDGRLEEGRKSRCFPRDDQRPVARVAAQRAPQTRQTHGSVRRAHLASETCTLEMITLTRRRHAANVIVTRGAASLNREESRSLSADPTTSLARARGLHTAFDKDLEQGER